MAVEVAGLRVEAEGWTAQELLTWAAAEYEGGIALASSFGAEDMVLIDLVSRMASPIPVFTLDTDFLFSETYDLIRRTEAKYGISVEMVRPLLTPEEQAQVHGDALWGRQPDQCCGIRKVAPLKQKLSGLRAWVTGIRRDQSPTRASAKKVDWDSHFELVKVNPLADWTGAEVWQYIRAHDVPYNPLHDLNFPSIGCTHCTLPVDKGSDERAGRWSGFAKTECGLHGR